MAADSAVKVLQALIYAYYEKRSVEDALACVTDDIEWVGTEAFDTARGREALRALLVQDVKSFPEPFCIEVETPLVQALGDTAAMVTLCGRQIAVPGKVCGFSVRGTACCVKTGQGWLVRNIHTSVPNSEIEKYSLERQLDETRRKEETLMSVIPGGTAIYRMKKDGRVENEYVSDGFCHLLGYRNSTELMARSRSNALREIPPEEGARVLQKVKDCLQNHRPISVEYLIYTKDHALLPVRMDASAISEQQLAEDDIAVLYAVHTRVSEESQRAFREQQRYRTILDALGMAFLEWDREKGFYASERYAQYALSEQNPGTVLSNQGSMETIHPDDVSQLKQFFGENEHKKRDRVNVSLRLKMKDGTYRWTEMLGFLYYDEAEHINRVIGILRDIDKEWIEQNKRLQAALSAAESANRAKTDFLSRVSHDMRTPLNGILGLTTLLKGSVRNPDAQRDLAQLELSGQYLLNLINDTLDVGRIESGRMELHPVVCDGRTVFNNVISLAHPSMEAKHIQFHLHADNLPFTTLYMDVSRVEQIVMNILGNAVKFTPEGGQIDVTMVNLEVKDGVVTDRLTVQDNGVGMSKEFLPHLFEPFSQENSSTTNANEGTGLGMTITRQLVELMGGSVEVESRLGVGTCISVTLPMPVATDEQIARWHEQQAAPAGRYVLRGKRVLLCEDHPLNTTIATRLLAHKQMTVEHAENGKVGVDMFAASPDGYYDVVLMDIRMPVLDGIEAAKRIRRLPREDAHTVPILAMTANALDEDVRKTREAGMNAHLSKPIETEKLYQTLEQALKTRQEYRRQRVLVVDDREVNRIAIRRAISQDFDVYEAENGVQALAMLQERHGINAVVTDIQMPEMDGRELIRRIRAEEKFQHVAIIANTQYGDPEQEKELLALGANEFVYKPTTPQLVVTRIRDALLWV